ncbi:MAG: hypothetical protein L6R40_001675 [Gallowayella cf. fulva]|nr:MAG: hypothetical protein L6R40_001675 [Xanthomendoza cf. fulva]
MAKRGCSKRSHASSQQRQASIRNVLGTLQLTNIADNGSQWVDEPPETPAPVFAVRAFKTAIFGTPHPNQAEATDDQEKPSPDKPARSKHSPRAKVSTPKIGHKSHASRTPKPPPLISPAKGILLTPGTATTRRKSVSFGNLETKIGATTEKLRPDSQAATVESEIVTSVPSPLKIGEDDPKQPTLTKDSFKALLDASKQRLTEHDRPVMMAKEGEVARGGITPHRCSPVPSNLNDITTDYTVDLTKPRSQSGQHWKAEFERYQKNSDRELKRVIQHGQNVKSYAEKKDSEATELQEKLKRVLAKCEAMETKISKSATQLASGRKHGIDGTAEQESLMNDLSRQTALAVKYKQKADRYRMAIQQQRVSALGLTNDEDPDIAEDLMIDGSSVTGPPPPPDSATADSDLSGLKAELRALRLQLGIAEEKASSLEALNAKLSKDFQSVKNEMKNYAGRRARKMAMLNEREERLVAEKNACEAKLKQLTKDHEDLLRRVSEPAVRSVGRQQIFPPNRQSASYNRKSVVPGERRRTRLEALLDRAIDCHADKASGTDPKADCPQQSNRPGPKGLAIDIWTMETPDDSGNTTPSAAEPAINLSSIAVSEASHEALREIDMNSVSEYPLEATLPPDSPRPTLDHLATMDSHLQPDFPSSGLTSAVKRIDERRNITTSPRPSMVSMLSSTVKHKPSQDTTGYRSNASLVSTTGNRRSTMASLPPDRAAAARARLAQRKSMKESNAMNTSALAT